MKISSASKKVLASALSAAMVVAFAPTVAFGAAANDRITLSYDMAGGAVTGNVQEIESGVVKVESGSVVKTADASAYEKSGYAFKNFIVDLNGNGKLDTNETTVNGNTNLDVSEIAAGSTVKLIAQYSVPTVTAAGHDDGVSATKDGQLWFSVGTANSIDGNNYEIALAKDGTTLTTVDFKGGTTNIKSAFGNYPYLGVNFGQAENKSLYKGNYYGFVDLKAEMGAGTYTATLTDKTKNVVLGSSSFQIINVAVDGAGCIFNTKADGSGQFVSGLDFMAAVGQKWQTAVTNAGVTLDVYKDANTAYAKRNVNADGYALAGYKAGDTEITIATSKVEADQTVLKAYYAAPGFTSALALAGTAGSYELDYTLGNFVDASSNPYFAEYKLTVTAPDGTKLVDAADATAAAGTVDFGALTPALGTYTATLTGKKDGEVKTLATSSTTVVKVVVDTNNGKTDESAGYTDSSANDANGKLYNAGDKTSFTKTEISGWAAPTTVPNGKVFDKWTVDGVAITYNTSNQFVIPAGTGNVVTFKATWKDEASVMAAKPSYSYANGKVVLSTAQGSDYEIVYGTATGTYPNTYSATGSGIAVNTTTFGDTIYAQVKGKANASASTLQASRELEVSGYVASGQIAALNNKIGTFGAMKTSDATPTAPKYWDKTLKAETDAAVAAIKAIGYASTEDWNAAVLAQAKTVLDAAAAYETAQAKAAGTLVKAADGKTYSFATASEVEKATAAVQAAVEAFVENNDGDADFVDYSATKKAWVKAAVPATNTAAYYIGYMTAAVDAIVSTTVTAAVAEPAIATDAALASAKTVAEAEAALAQFEALTAEQQELVSAASVAAAQKIVLVDTQDASAAKDVKAVNKTYKSKNGKLAATKTFKMKAITSKSGAKATYKKANTAGKSKITVAKSGKVTIKKGLKKGTYKVKVKGTVGAHAKTVTCKIVVK